MKPFAHCLLFSLAFVLACCTPNAGSIEEVIAPGQASQLTEQTQLKSSLAEGLAHSLAKAQENEAIRLFLKEAMIQRFDGDYNALVVALWHEPVGEIGFGQRLWQLAPVPGYASAAQFYEAVTQHHALLQIALPALPGLSPEGWQASKRGLPVTVAPAHEAAGETITRVKGFHPHGHTLYYSLSEAPDHLVLVVSENERVFFLGKGSPFEGRLQGEAPFLSTAHGQYYTLGWGSAKARDQNQDILPPDEDGPTGDDTGGDPVTDRGNCGLACDRDCYTEKDELVRFRFTSTRAYNDAKDGWLDGDIEILARVIFFKPNNIGHIDYTFSIREKDVKDLQWYYLNTELFTWDKQVHGPDLKFAWFELDGGRVTTFDAGGISTTIRENDVPLGNALVQYCDNTDGPYGHQYNASLSQYITFNVR